MLEKLIIIIATAINNQPSKTHYQLVNLYKQSTQINATQVKNFLSSTTDSLILLYIQLNACFFFFSVFLCPENIASSKLLNLTCILQPLMSSI